MGCKEAPQHLNDHLRSGGRHDGHLQPFGVGINYHHKGLAIERACQVNVHPQAACFRAFPAFAPSDGRYWPRLWQDSPPPSDGLIHVQPPLASLSQHFHLDDAWVAHVQGLEDTLSKLLQDYEPASPKEAAVMSQNLVLLGDEGMKYYIH